MIGVIDYRAGNAASVLYALQRLGVTAEAVHTAEELEKYQGLILSGMGSADAAIISLESEELLEALQERVLMEKVPLLGIGTGMEILFEHSEEDDTPCLGWLPGEAFLLPKTERMPQIGYYEVKLLEKHPLFEGCKGTERYFFSGASYIRSEDAQLVLGAEALRNRITHGSGLGEYSGGRFPCRKKRRRWIEGSAEFREIRRREADSMRQIRSITEAAQAEKAYLEGAEELFMAAEKVTPEMVSLAAQTPIPVTVCGGVRSMNDIYQLLKAGAQQVCLGQAAAAYSHLITQAALAFGRQSIAVYLPVRRISLSEKITSGYEAMDETGRENLGLDALEWAKQAASLGAGTLILEEGTPELAAQIAEAVTIPVLVCFHGKAGGGEYGPISGRIESAN